MTLVQPRSRWLFAGVWPVCRKEFTHISRDRATLFFALIIPVVQLLFFGFAIDTNVRQIPTVVFDQARTQESRRLIDSFENSDAFRVTEYVSSDNDLYGRIRGASARVGIKIPVDFSRHLLEGSTASVLILVDGSDSAVTSFAVNVSNGIMLQESLKRTAAISAL
ncbi:MAG TPA: ABC transporter permease, partial [Bryobacteraceae bacterium]|nr:ABC transporter permease [Bryobacteraceae bacterium]